MNTKRLITTSIFALISASAVQAADVMIPHQPTPVTSSTSAFVAPAFTWEGFYFGGQGGGFSSKTDMSIVGKHKTKPLSKDLSPKLSGFEGGLYAGSNIDLGDSFVLSIDTDFTWSGQKNTKTITIAEPENGAVDGLLSRVRKSTESAAPAKPVSAKPASTSSAKQTSTPSAQSASAKPVNTQSVSAQSLAVKLAAAKSETEAMQLMEKLLKEKGRENGLSLARSSKMVEDAPSSGVSSSGTSASLTASTGTNSSTVSKGANSSASTGTNSSTSSTGTNSSTSSKGANSSASKGANSSASTGTNLSTSSVEASSSGGGRALVLGRSGIDETASTQLAAQKVQTIGEASSSSSSAHGSGAHGVRSQSGASHGNGSGSGARSHGTGTTNPHAPSAHPHTGGGNHHGSHPHTGGGNHHGSHPHTGGGNHHGSHPHAGGSNHHGHNPHASSHHGAQNAAGRSAQGTQEAENASDVYGIEQIKEMVSELGLEDNGTIGTLSHTLKQNWAGATRVRIGFAADRFMPYVAGGVAYTQLQDTVSVSVINDDGTVIASKNLTDETKTMVGYTVGGGVDFAMLDNVILRAEYRYSDFGKKKFAKEKLELKYRTNEFRVGVAYKF